MESEYRIKAPALHMPTLTQLPTLHWSHSTTMNGERLHGGFQNPENHTPIPKLGGVEKHRSSCKLVVGKRKRSRKKTRKMGRLGV